MELIGFEPMTSACKAGALPTELQPRFADSESQIAGMVGLSRFELLTSRLSGVRSNQLSYRPETGNTPIPWKLDRRNETVSGSTLCNFHSPVILQGCSVPGAAPRKEVIQPQVLLQLPCYDFTPIADHTMDGCLP